MIPEVFKELDTVAAKDFAFLISEKNCSGPTVEYWRDFFLVYQSQDDVRIRVGMERDWLVPFIFVEYSNAGCVLFNLVDILDRLNIAADSAGFPVSEAIRTQSATQERLHTHRSEAESLRSEWPRVVKEYSKLLRDHFEEVIAFARTTGIERTRSGKSVEAGPQEAKETGVVVRAADQARRKRELVLGSGIGWTQAVIGPGSHFMEVEFVPITREKFWRITDGDYEVPYSAGTCPSCERTGNLGVKQTALGKFSGVAKRLSLMLLVVSTVGCVALSAWRESGLVFYVTLATLIVWAAARLAERSFGQANFCPECGWHSRSLGS